MGEPRDPMDTFLVSAADKGTKTQETYSTIGGLLRSADRRLLDLLWASCHDCKVLGESSLAAELIEAHIFKTVKMNLTVRWTSDQISQIARLVDEWPDR